MFLTEQGYRYRILYGHELADFEPERPLERTANAS